MLAEGAERGACVALGVAAGWCHAGSFWDVSSATSSTSVINFRFSSFMAFYDVASNSCQALRAGDRERRAAALTTLRARLTDGAGWSYSIVLVATSFVTF